ncbi:unnamed protein product [Closterium sp. NIES-53]
MASLRVLEFDHEGRSIQFDTWLDDLQLYLLCDSRDSVSLFAHTSGAVPAPPATADSVTPSQIAQALYDGVVARYSSPATVALGCLLLPYLFPELSTFATVEDLVSHLRTSDARYRAAVPADGGGSGGFGGGVGGSGGGGVSGGSGSGGGWAGATQRGGSGDGLRQQQQRQSETPSPQQLREWFSHCGAFGGGGSCPYGIRTGRVVAEFGDEAEHPRWAELLSSGVAIFDLDYDVILAARYAFSVSAEGDSYMCVPPDPGIEAVALGASESALPGTTPAEALHTFTLDSTTLTPLSAPVLARLADPSAGPVLACSSTVLPCPVVPSDSLSGLHLPSFSMNLVSTAALQDAMVITTSPGGQRVSICTCTRTGRHLAVTCLGIEAAALGASESSLPGNAPAQALHTFTLNSGASRCFFRDSTTLTPLSAPVPLRLANPSRDPVLAHSSTVLPCPAVLSSSLSRLHLPSFSTNLVSALGQVAPPCSCRLLTHQTLQWHHRLGHPSLPRLRGMHSRLLVSGLPRSLPPLPPSPAPPCLPCVEGRQRAAPHSSSFPPTTAPLQTLHMDVSGPARVSGQGRERYFLLVVDDYTHYTTVFPLHSKEEVPNDLPVVRLHSDRGGEFSSDFLRDICCREGILRPFTVPDSPQQNGIAERRIGLVMEVARTSMIHLAAPHFLWPFAVRYAAHQLNLWPRVSLPETSPTLHWTGQVGDALVFWVWGSRAFVRDTSTDKLSARAIPCVFLGFSPDAPGWQFYHPTSRRVFSSKDVTFDESVPFYRSPSPWIAPVEVALGSGAARGAVSGGAASGGPAPVEVAGGAGGTMRPRPYFVPLLQQPDSPQPAPSPYTEQTGGLRERREPTSCPASLVRTGRRVPRLRPPLVPGTHAMALRSSSVQLRVPLPPPPKSSLPAVPDPESDRAPLVAELVDFAAACRLNYATALVAESVSASPPSVASECALGTDILEDRQEDFECLAAAVPRFASMLRAAEGDPDAPDIPTPRSYAEAIMGPYSSQWQAAMDAEMESWKSTGTYVNAVPPSRANIVNGMWIFRMTTLRVLLHVAAQRDYELHSLDFSTAYLQGSLQKEIWLRCPPGFTGSFSAGTQWSLRQIVYGLCQALCEWHDTLRTTLAALGFTPSTAYLSLVQWRSSSFSRHSRHARHFRHSLHSSCEVDERVGGDGIGRDEMRAGADAQVKAATPFPFSFPPPSAIVDVSTPGSRDKST